MRWILIVTAALVGIVAGILVVGLMLPQEHVASVSRVVRGSPQEAWEAITTVEELATWRPGVDRTEVLEPQNGMPVWRETGRTGTMTLETTEWDPPRRLVTRIADEGLPFGGTWTYELEPVDDGTLVTITENGEVYNPIFRVMARFVFGYEGTARTYLEGLAVRVEA